MPVCPLSRSITLYCMIESDRFKKGIAIYSWYIYTPQIWFKSKQNEFSFVQTRQTMPVCPDQVHNSAKHDGIRPVQERNRDILLIQFLWRFSSNQVKNETTRAKEKYACFAPTREHYYVMHDGTRLFRERNQDLHIRQVFCKFGPNQNTHETSIVKTK